MLGVTALSVLCRCCAARTSCAPPPCRAPRVNASAPWMIDVPLSQPWAARTPLVPRPKQGMNLHAGDWRGLVTVNVVYQSAGVAVCEQLYWCRYVLCMPRVRVFMEAPCRRSCRFQCRLRIYRSRLTSWLCHHRVGMNRRCVPRDERSDTMGIALVLRTAVLSCEAPFHLCRWMTGGVTMCDTTGCILGAPRT